MRLAVGGAHVVDIGTAHVVQVLRRDVALEDVLEVRRQPEVDVEEVRHVGDVVDDLAAVGALDEHRVPPPVGPPVVGELRDLRDAHLGLRWVALVVVPDEQQPAAHVGLPRAGAGQPGCALGVGHQLAFAVATPAPVVERAGDLVALDRALREVAAHVAAVAVEDLDVAMGVGEHDQHGAEDLDPVRLAVEVVLHRAEAVPTAGKPVGQGSGVDLANASSGGFRRHDTPPSGVSN